MVITFDPVDSDLYLEKTFDLQDEDDYEPFNDNFEFLGYESSNFIYLIGMPIFHIFLYIILCVLYVILKRLKFKRLKH